MANLTEINQVYLDNVTLAQSGIDPVLQSVDFNLPTDQTIVIESSNPNSSLHFLQFLSGTKPCSAGRLLWNGQDIFSDEQDIDPHKFMGSYFEGVCYPLNISVNNFFTQSLSHPELEVISEQLDLSPYLNNELGKLSYSWQKLISIALVVSKNPQLLLLEDPATGLTESQWLNLLDLFQYKQRQGYLRHVFMTNHHPTAINHLEHNKLFLEDGIIYFDETLPAKKVAHY